MKWLNNQSLQKSTWNLLTVGDVKRSFWPDIYVISSFSTLYLMNTCLHMNSFIEILLRRESGPLCDIAHHCPRARRRQPFVCASKIFFSQKFITLFFFLGYKISLFPQTILGYFAKKKCVSAGTFSAVWKWRLVADIIQEHFWIQSPIMKRS